MSFRAILFWAALLYATAAIAATTTVGLVLVTADQHSAYDRTAQLVATVDRLKAENPGLPLAILLDGDTQEYGNVVARRSAGAIDFAMLAAFARRAPTILNLGNHEPEFYDLAETVRRVHAAGVTVISNIVDQTTGLPVAASSTKLKLGREEAVVVGLATDKLSTYRGAIRPTLELANPVAWARRNFPGLLATAPQHIILSHAGLAADREILPLVPDGTLFAGAHDHLRFVQPTGRGVYFHSGSWNEYLSLAWLRRDDRGETHWDVEQRRIQADGPADSVLAALIRETKAKYLTGEDAVVIGRAATAFTPAGAARFAARALARAAETDAAFIGNTTFGAGLPAGDITRVDFDACVRFDGAVFTAEVDGARLRKLLAEANQDSDTPFDQRHGEFCFADGPATIDPAGHYHIATTDWGARNTQAYFGGPAIVWREKPGLRLKSLVQAALAPR